MTRRARILTVSVAATALVAALVIALVVAVLPRFGVNVVPPSPQTYADQAIGRMTDAIHAAPGRVDRVRARVDRAVADARDYRDTYPALRRAAKELGGRHSRFFTPEEAAVSFGTEDSGSSADPVGVSTADDVTTVRIPNLGSNDREVTRAWIRAAARRIDAAAPTTRAWLVDLRGNGGGNVYPMLAVLTPMLDDGTVLSFEYRERSIPVEVRGTRVLVGGSEVASSPGDAGRERRPVAVLLDGDTASSAEAVAIAFVGQDRVRSFGAPTYGVSTANEGRPLYDGARVNITVAVDADRDGTRYGGPLEPDVPAEDAAAAASAWLAGQIAT